MEKSADAFRTISEVADILQTPAHVLRFWESRFTQIRPVKRAGGRRYYRPSDISLLAGIRKLLHEDGMTIRGVQKILREQGVRRVADMAQVPEAGFVEVEVEDTPPTAEVHPFPARRPAPQVTAEAASWTFSPAADDAEEAAVTEEEFFAKASPAEADTQDDGPPPPLATQDAALARERAERLRAPISVTASPLIPRLLALEPGAFDAAALRPLVARMLALHTKLTASER